MKIRRITAWIDFGEGVEPTDSEDAIQALIESLADDCAEVSFTEVSMQEAP